MSDLEDGYIREAERKINLLPVFHGKKRKLEDEIDLYGEMIHAEANEFN